MSDYNYDNKWSTKNDLADSAALKVVDADEFHTEFNLIETAVNTKSNKASNLSDLASNSTAVTNLGFTVTAASVAGKDTANEYTKTQNFNATGLTDGATIAWDASINQVCSVTLAGNRTMAAPTNLVDGGFYHLTIIQDGSGSRTITWNAVFKFPSDTAPTLTTTAAEQDELTFRSNGTNLYLIGQSLAVA
jgi:hypothetical protein|tara:strand:+ start:2803 stop:3375 length:573 start_codon:yes stop_codon:yes gene_type:complete